MSALSIQPTYPIFTDIDGQPLEDGFVWIGQANLDPQVNPINVFWDAALTIPAGQPIRTLAGYPSNSGTPARLYVNSDYSIRVMNKNGSVVYSAPAATERYSADLISITGFKGQAGTVNDLTSATGSDWIGFTQSGSGVEPHSVQDKLRQVVSVFDFLTDAEITAIQTGSLPRPDVTAKIQAAVYSASSIYFPPGQYYITSPILWQGQWLIGAVDNGELSTAANQTMIIADGTHAAFKYYNQFGFNSQGGGIKNFNILFADGLIPATASTRPNAIGFLVTGSDGYPAFYSVENVTVRGGMWAVYDQSGAWMATYKHINSQHNYAGFYKRYGTTINFENCYHREGYAGWYIIDCLGVSMDACAFDLVSSINRPSYLPMFVENSNVVVNGGDFEGNILEGSDGRLIFANGANAQVQFNGSRFIFTSIGSPGIGNENYLVFADNGAKVSMNNVDFSTPTRTGTDGGVFYSVAKSSSVVTWKNCNIPQFGGTGSAAPGNYSGQGYSGGTVDFDGTKFYYPWSIACYQQEKAIKYTTTYDPASIPANDRITATFTVGGAEAGDYTYVVFEWPTYGVIIDSFVTAANQVTVVFNNITAAPIDLPSATLRISVVKKFYSQ